MSLYEHDRIDMHLRAVEEASNLLSTRIDRLTDELDVKDRQGIVPLYLVCEAFNRIAETSLPEIKRLADKCRRKLCLPGDHWDETLQ